MKKILLDTNFILTCIKQKIDFFEKLKLMGIQILIPKQVIRELEKKDKTGLSLELLEKHNFKKIDLKQRYVDKGIINFAKKHPEVFIATLDKEIKNKVKNQKVIIREKKRLEII